jgi:Zn-dependent peptidase ImmA (M78 family)
MISMETLEDKAEKTLYETDTYRLPVPIHLVAQRLNLTLEALPLEDFSGMMIVRGNRGAIGYNSAHARVRQRFTMAHEVAHFLLHSGENGKPRLFVDKNVMFRTDEDSSAKRNRENVEACRFGAALLMPKKLVLKQIQNDNLILDDDEAIKSLAKEFWVSQVAMTNRLLSLGMCAYPVSP